MFSQGRMNKKAGRLPTQVDPIVTDCRRTAVVPSKSQKENGTVRLVQYWESNESDARFSSVNMLAVGAIYHIARLKALF